MVFSVVDKSSFTRAEQILTMLQDMDLLRSRAVILAANKIDLARSRAVSTQGLYTPEIDYYPAVVFVVDQSDFYTF